MNEENKSNLLDKKITLMSPITEHCNKFSYLHDVLKFWKSTRISQSFHLSLIKK